MTQNDARSAYRRKMQQRQTVLFGSIAAVLAALMVVAMLIWSGILPFPFLKTFHSNKADTITPCLTSDTAKAAEPSSINVSVYNATSGTGLATNAGAALARRGFVVERTENYSSNTDVNDIIISTGVGGIVGAYTLQQYLPDSVVRFDSSITDDNISLILGDNYKVAVDEGKTTILDAATVAKNNPDGTLTSASTCQDVTN